MTLSLWWSALMLIVSLCCVLGRHCSFRTPSHALLRILLHSDRQVHAYWPGRMPHFFPMPTSDYIISTLAAHVWSAYHSATYSKCGFHNICFIYCNCICTSHLRSQLCLNRHRTTGIELLLYVPFSSSYALSCCIMCGLATRIGIHLLGLDTPVMRKILSHPLSSPSFLKHLLLQALLSYSPFTLLFSSMLS